MRALPVDPGAARGLTGFTGRVGEIKVGTASWTDKTLLASGWYPADADTPEKRLAYYAKQFPLVEVDATYYSPPAEQTAVLWAQRTPPEFTFNIKAYSLLTGHPTRVSSIFKDLRPETDKTNVYPKDLPPQAYEEIWTRFLSALDPLVSAGKLGALLFQFPPWFGIRRSNKNFLVEVRDRVKPLQGRLVIPGLSLGILLGALVIIAAWVLIWIYVRWANTRYDAAIEKTLNELGIFRLEQIAGISEYDIDRIAARLRGLRSRIYREDWIGQARSLLYRESPDPA